MSRAVENATCEQQPCAAPACIDNCKNKQRERQEDKEFERSEYHVIVISPHQSRGCPGRTQPASHTRQGAGCSPMDFRPLT